ncbi:P-loop NTPase [bacterium]|jgi:Mrp family chromosome partitioning ATPase|nr:P-loop NTPase [bacterium]
MTNNEQVLEKLSVIIDPDLDKDIVTLGFIKKLKIEKGNVSFSIELTTPACPVKDMFKKEAERVVKELDWVETVEIEMTAQPIKQKPSQMKGLERVRHIIAVGSGKGGVGKSMVATNLAFSLSKTGAKVGLFDADVYGPSLPTMVGFENISLKMEGAFIEPLDYEGVKLMSFGYATESSGESGPAIMRGPMVSQVIQQLLGSTDWGELDYLILDMPPGTGDIQLTIGQQVPVTAAVIVTTPQRISFVDVVKGIQMFDELKIPTIAVVENMAYFKCNDCSKKHQVFGKGALNSLSEEFGFTQSFQLPMQYEVSYYSDNGQPLVLAEPDNEVTQLFAELSEAVVREVSKLAYVSDVKVELTAPKKGVVEVKKGDETALLSSAGLRLSCRCAYCVDELSGKQRIEKSTIKADIHPVDIKRVGNYAFGINWNDGHTSLYPIKAIEALSQKPEPVLN